MFTVIGKDILLFGFFIKLVYRCFKQCNDGANRSAFSVIWNNQNSNSPLWVWCQLLRPKGSICVYHFVTYSYGHQDDMKMTKKKKTQLLLIGRVMTDGRLNARVKADITDKLVVKANAQVSAFSMVYLDVTFIL